MFKDITILLSLGLENHTRRKPLTLFCWDSRLERLLAMIVSEIEECMHIFDKSKFDYLMEESGTEGETMI